MNDPSQRKKKVNIEVPADLSPIYANLAVIAHSPSEFIVDFAQILPNTPRARVQTRILMTPLHAKLLLGALQENIERYEAQFGEIQSPSGGDDLARDFFGGVRPPDS